MEYQTPWHQDILRIEVEAYRKGCPKLRRYLRGKWASIPFFEDILAEFDRVDAEEQKAK